MLPTLPFLHRFLSWRLLAATVACLVVVYVLTIAILLAREDRLVYHPVPSAKRGPDPQPTLPFQDLALRTAAGTSIHARWFPCEGTDRAVVYCHGRAGNLTRELRSPEIAVWHRVIKSSILVFDYPGYGRSTGTPTEAGCYAAAEAAYHWLTQVRGMAPRQVLICGRSLGTAVAVDLASRHPCRALILIAPLTSLPDVALSYFPLLPARQLMRNQFDSLAKIGRCSQPLFIVHGTRDSVVPYAQGKALFEAANEPKEFLTVEGANHGGCVSVEFFVALGRFLEETEVATLSPRSSRQPAQRR